MVLEVLLDGDQMKCMSPEQAGGAEQKASRLAAVETRRPVSDFTSSLPQTCL